MSKTPAKFIKFKGEVVALFPNEVADSNGNTMSYQHIGQHSAASKGLYKCRYAKPLEFNNLKNELERIGYVLQIQCPKYGWRS